MRTHILMFYLIWYEVIVGSKCRILVIFHVYQGKKLSCSKLLQKKTSGSKLGFLLPIMSMAVTWHRLRMGPRICILPERHHWRTPCLKVCIKESPCPVVQDRVSDCTFTRCKHKDCYLIIHVRKYTLRGYFRCFLCPYYNVHVKQLRSIQFFNLSSVIYMRVQVNSSIIANICWLIQTFKYQCCGFQMHFKWIMLYNL